MVYGAAGYDSSRARQNSSRIQKITALSQYSAPVFYENLRIIRQRFGADSYSYYSDPYQRIC